MESGGPVSSEPPRPQPKATLTFFCVIFLAVGAQLWSWSVLARHKHAELRALKSSAEADAPEAPKAESLSLWLARRLDWAPRDPSLFLPRLFREAPPAPLFDLPTEDVDDDRVLYAFSASSGEPTEAQAGASESTQGSGVAELSTNERSAELDSTRDEVLAQVKLKAQRQAKSSQGQAKSAQGQAKSAQGAQGSQVSRVTKLQEPERPEGRSGEDLKLSVQQEQEPNAEGSGLKSWKERPRRVRKRGGVPLLSVEDPNGALRPFFKRLALAKSGRKVRVMHYGDSLIAGDYVTSTMRRLLQKRFGYGGVGYVLAGKPSPWYGRTGLKLKAKRWKADRATRSTSKLSIYGLGGVSFRSRSRGSYVRAEVEEQAQLDARVDRLELHYLAQPKGGQLSVRFGPSERVISTTAEQLGPARVLIEAPLGLHKVELKPVGDGEVRLLGMSLERSGGGVVYDALGLTGSRAQQQLKWDRATWIQQAKWRQPDLFVIHYGTNESENTRMSMSRYAEVLRDVIQRLKAVNPEASCLFVSPMDRAYKDEETGRIRTRPIIPKIVKTQREVSLAEGCAFWSAYDAMGGWGSLKRWYRASPPLAGGDLTHPTRRGANLLGAMFYSALMEAYTKSGGS